VVDDHAQWRRYLCSILLQAPARWQIVGEAADGLEAVHQADALDPDLILLDIGLPVLNGIEAARRILARRPHSRVLFVSQQMSRDVLQAAAGAGARGYVIKSDAGSELFPAMAAIAEGGRFFSRRLRSVHRHELHLYSEEASLIEKYVLFAEEALHFGDMVVIVADDSRQMMIQRRLEGRGLDVHRAIQERRYRAMGVRTALSKILVDGWPDETRFLQAWLPVIEEATRRGDGGPSGRLSCCGDGAATLWQEGRGDAAVHLERLWDAFSKLHHIDVLCGYQWTEPTQPHDAPAFQHICAAHSTVPAGRAVASI